MQTTKNMLTNRLVILKHLLRSLRASDGGQSYIIGFLQLGGIGWEGMLLKINAFSSPALDSFHYCYAGIPAKKAP